MKLTIKALVGAAIVSLSTAAFALPTTGGISFVANSPDSGFDSTDVWFGAGPDNAQVKSSVGDYANYFAFNDEVTFYDFEYDPYVPTKLIWEGSGSVDSTHIEFYLENLSSADYDTSTLELHGKGYITDGTDEIEVMWNFTGNKADKSFSWSSSTSVPEPGTLALLGLGLAGLGAARRRQKD